MLELRPTCEHCNKLLPPSSTNAMICTFECTFCKNCVENLLENVCPNCGGGFQNRPVRPSHLLAKYPASQVIIHKNINEKTFEILKNKNRNIPPESR